MALQTVYTALIDALPSRTGLVKSKQNADIKGVADEYRDEETAIVWDTRAWRTANKSGAVNFAKIYFNSEDRVKVGH